MSELHYTREKIDAVQAACALDESTAWGCPNNWWEDAALNRLAKEDGKRTLSEWRERLDDLRIEVQTGKPPIGFTELRARIGRPCAAEVHWLINAVDNGDIPSDPKTAPTWELREAWFDMFGPMGWEGYQRSNLALEWLEGLWPDIPWEAEAGLEYTGDPDHNFYSE